MPRKLENEAALLEQYCEQLEKLIVQLGEADPQRGKQIQKELDQRLEIYRKQIQLVQTEFPDADDGKLHEASFYTVQAGKKVFGSGFLRRVASKSSNMAVGLATGMIAKQQEKHAAREALVPGRQGIHFRQADEGRDRESAEEGNVFCRHSRLWLTACARSCYPESFS